MTYLKQNKGFTLVELAIVIVIIGFLVAGIAAGANMIKQAELRSLITDLQQHQVAYNNFIGRYNKVPGDMDTASSFWTATSGATSCAAVITNCNGNGDGIITHRTTIATTGGNEVIKSWKHLSLAGMIAAGVQQLNAATTGLVTIGTEAPNSKKSGAGFFMSGGGVNVDVGALVVSPFATSTNAVYVGRTGPAASSLINAALTAEEAFNIDQKLDDGLVNAGVFTGGITGVVRAFDAANATAAGDCVTVATGAYDIPETNASCVLGLALN